MALHGSIEEAGLPSVLQLLALGGKTGCISVERGKTHGAIYLDGGTVVWADIVSTGDRLGENLVRSGKITRDQLRYAIEQLTHNATATLADVLVNSEALARGELDRFVQHQVEEAIYLMCSWTDGQFDFAANVRPPRHAIPVALLCERLLIEAGRRADDWQVIHQAIPSFEGIYRRVAPRPGATAPDLTLDQHRILPLLDGTRDVNGLIQLSGLSTFEVAKALLELIMSGAVQLQERRASTRHFDEAGLRAYAARQGEYADPERRKDAARHIADCQMCTSRLREFQLRRTSQTTPTPTSVPTPQAPKTPSAPPAPPKPPPPKPLVATPPVPMEPLPPSSRLSKDIVWLTSPQEADEIRRSQHRAAPPAPPAAKPPAPPAPKPAAAAAAPPPAPAPPPPPPPAPAPPKSVQKTAARMIAVPPPRPAPTPAAAEAEELTAPALAGKRAPWRVMALGTAAIIVILGGYFAVQTLGARPSTPIQAVAANTPAPTVAPPDTGNRGTAAPIKPDTGYRMPDTGTQAAVGMAPVAGPPRTDSTVSPASKAPPAPPVSRDSTDSTVSTVARPPAPAPAAAAPVEPAAPDAELSSGGWRVIDRAEAISALGGRIGTIPGLRVETIASSEARGRTRVRIAQIARTGQRIVLIETAGSEAPAGGSIRATAVSVMPPPDPGGESIGSASLGNLQITARSTLAADQLTALLRRLAVVSGP